jgi:hypothetical protein
MAVLIVVIAAVQDPSLIAAGKVMDVVCRGRPYLPG